MYTDWERETTLSTAQTRATPHPDVVRTELKNGDVVLLHLGAQTYFTLNPTGALIFGLLGQGLDVEAISHALVERYDVDLDQARASVTRLVDELAAAELLEVAD